MKIFQQPFIVRTRLLQHAGGAMSGSWHQTNCKFQQRFCLHFERRLAALMQWGYSAAEAFGPAWEAALDDVPLEAEDQAVVYRCLIAWAKAKSYPQPVWTPTKARVPCHSSNSGQNRPTRAQDNGLRATMVC